MPSRPVLAAVAALAAAAAAIPAIAQVGDRLELRTRIRVIAAPAAEGRLLGRCIERALERIPGVEVGADAAEWTMQVSYVRAASEESRSKARGTTVVAVTVARPFAGARLMSTLVKPEYRDLAARLVADLQTVSESRMYVAAGNDPSGTCAKIAADFDRIELEKKRVLLNDIRESLDADDHRHHP